MLIKKSFGEKIFDILNYTLFILFSLAILFPFIQQVTKSFSTAASIQQDYWYLYPKEFTFEAYLRLFSGGRIIKSFNITVFKTLVATALTILITSFTAYPLSKKYLPFRNIWTSLIVFTMFFSGGLIPSFLLVRSLGLYNSLWALILPTLFSPFYIIIMRNFFMSIPPSLEESALIDGAGEIKILMRIILPISTPVIATVVLWTMVAHWNAWFDGMIYINDKDKMVLQVLLRNIREQAIGLAGSKEKADLEFEMTKGELYKISEESIKAAILVIVITPIVLTYPFLQKYFVKGIMMGSLKG